MSYLLFTEASSLVIEKDKSWVNLYLILSNACWITSPQACTMVPKMSSNDVAYMGMANPNFTSRFNFSSNISGLLVAER